jgi:myo-inositol-1(or 4)-monophosphatase
MIARNADSLFDFMSETVREAGAFTLDFFRKGVEVISKADASPVTEADLGAETRMRARIRAAFPDIGILGEEFGAEGSRETYWIIDPIDGTKSFIHGVPLYTTLLALIVDGEPYCGAIYAPATQELCMAVTGKGCFYNGERARVRSCTALKNATLLTTDYPHIYKRGFGSGWETLAGQVKIQRTWGDAYGHMLVAAGRADIMFDPELNLWDAAPLKVIVEEAGGAYFDTNNSASIHTRHGFSAVPELRDAVLSCFNR